MGRYSRRDEAIRLLLSSQEGWSRYRDMELLDAAELFAGGTQESDRLGEARSCLELARLHQALGELYLELETDYIHSGGGPATPSETARLGLAKALRGDVRGAKEIFDSSPPQGSAAAWALGRAGIAAAEHRTSDAASLLRDAAVADKGKLRDLVALAAQSWGVAPEGRSGQVGPRGGSARLDRAGAPPAVEGISLSGPAKGVAPDLFQYALQRRAYANRALSSLAGAPTPAAAFLAGLASAHLGEEESAAAAFSRAQAASAGEGDPAWLFSPTYGPAEASRLARAFRGTALHRLGRPAEGLRQWREALAGENPGPLVTVTVAAAQIAAGAKEPFEKPRAATEDAVRAAAEDGVQLAGREGGELMPSLYASRAAAVAQAAAEVCLDAGDPRRALALLERSHKKSSGYRPDFVNPPAFFVALARAYTASGEYASAVAVLFELTRKYPACRPAYESLKRTYAARAGGEGAPRY